MIKSLSRLLPSQNVCISVGKVLVTLKIGPFPLKFLGEWWTIGETPGRLHVRCNFYRLSMAIPNISIKRLAASLLSLMNEYQSFPGHVRKFNYIVYLVWSLKLMPKWPPCNITLLLSKHWHTLHLKDDGFKIDSLVKIAYQHIVNNMEPNFPKIINFTFWVPSGRRLALEIFHQSELPVHVYWRNLW